MTYPESSTTLTATRPKSRLPWLIGGLAALLLLGGAAMVILFVRSDNAPEGASPAASAATPAPAAPKDLAVSGSLSLGLGDFEWRSGEGQGITGPTCAGRGGYKDIAVGASVTVTDAAGSVVAVDKLTASIPTGFSDDKTPTSCSLTFAVAGVPAGKGFYGVEVGSRGAVKFAEAALAKPVELTLG